MKTEETESHTETRSPFLRIISIAGGIGIFILAVVFFVRLEEPSTEATLVAIQPLRADVQVISPIRREVTRVITLPGSIVPMYQATLYSRVSGYLEWIGADKGDRVTKGQKLAVIDVPEIDEQHRQARANYSIKKLTFERMQRVWKEAPDVIAKQDVDVAEAEADAARHLMEQRAAMRNYTTILAPFSGVITARFADPGMMIQRATRSATQATPLLTLMDMSTVRVYIHIPQEDIPLKAYDLWGTPAQVVLKHIPDKVFEGKITRSTVALDPRTRTMLTEIHLKNPHSYLRPGMFAEVKIPIERKTNALVLPPGAILSNPNGSYVFVLEDGRVHRTQISIGFDSGTWVEIAAGLDGHEEVVIVGHSSLSDGQLVNASPYNLPSGKVAQ